MYCYFGSFNPNYSIPPCEFIKEEMKSLRMSVRKLIRKSGLEKDTVKSILNNTKRITPQIAEGLSKALTSPRTYWQRLQLIYDHSKLQRNLRK